MRVNHMDPDRYVRNHKIQQSDFFQKFHIMPNVGLLNDPNGLTEYGGKYHLFYQTHPFAPWHDVKYWFHLLSEDLVHWEEAGFALKPEYWYEVDGCCSGSAVEKDGALYLFYTGKVLDKERIEPAEQYQAVALSHDGINFIKKTMPLLGPLGKGFSPHFRDPKVWKRGEWYYMIVAAQTSDRLPQIVGYRSRELVEWEYLGPMKKVDYRFGFMWECPGFNRIGDKDVLFICPQGATYYNDPNHNYHQCGYLAGELDYDDFSFSHEPFQQLDEGFEYYAAYVYSDSKGRHICIGWMGLPGESDQPTKEEGYLHCMSIATELRWENGKLCRRPIQELDSLFHREIRIARREGTVSFIAHAYRMKCRLAARQEKLVKFYLRDNGEGSKLVLQINGGEVTLDRSHTITRYDVQRTVNISLDGPLELDIFVDISSIEIFINGGEHAMSGRFFVDGDAGDNTVCGLDNEDDVKVMDFGE